MTILVAIAVPLLAASAVATAPDRVREVYRQLDLFGLDHEQEEGTAKILKRTPLGSALTLSMMVLVLALSISTLIDFVEDNFQLNSTLQPTASRVPGISRMRVEEASIFITVHQQQGSACASSSGVVRLTGGGTEQWTRDAVQQRDVPSGGAGITCSYRISCSQCVLSALEPLTVSLSAPFHAQSAVWGMHTDSAWAPEMHQQPKYSTASGQAQAGDTGPLTSAAWSVSAIRSVVHDERSDEYSYGYILAQAGADVRYDDSGKYTAGFLPGNDNVTYSVTVDVPITAQGTTITARSTLVSLLGALGGLLGGITGLFHALFPHAEKGVAVLLRKGKCVKALQYLVEAPAANAPPVKARALTTKPDPGVPPADQSNPMRS